MGLHSPLHPDLFIPVTMRACTHAYDKYITFTRIHTYIYMYIFFRIVSSWIRERKKRGERREKGKENGKMGDQRWEIFLKGSLPGRFLFNPSSTRSFAFVNSSFITVNERLSLFKAWRYPRWLKCIARIFARIETAGMEKIKSLCRYCATCSWYFSFYCRCYAEFWNTFRENLSIAREEFFFFISFEIANNLVPSLLSMISLISSINTN